MGSVQNVMVPIGSKSVSEIETGAEENHFLFKKFKYPSKSVIKSSSSEEMSTTPEPSSSVPAAEPVEQNDRLPANSATILEDTESRGEHQSDGQLSRDKLAYLIRWNRFEEQVCNSFSELFCSEHFVDVTLACEGELLKAHKIVLAMSSPFFRRIFQETPCKHPVVIIKGMTSKTLRNILQYIYLGEVVLNKSDINNFMDAADYLSICGVLANLYSCDISATTIKDGKGTAESEEDCKFSDAAARISEAEETGVQEEPESSDKTEDETPITSQSAVIKYHGVKSRWTRRYSNTSFPGTSTITSPVVLDQKRSASAGEVESTQQSNERNVSEPERVAPSHSEPLAETTSDIEMETGREESDRYDEPQIASPVDKHRKIIQRAYPKFYGGRYEEGAETQAEDWKTPKQERYPAPPELGSSTGSSSSATISRPYHRAAPYSLGAKDFSCPLQVNVEPNPHSMYAASSSSSSSGFENVAARTGKFPSGFTLFSSSHSLPSQRSMYRTQSESDFPLDSSPISLVSSHNREERVVKPKIEQTGSLTTSPTYRHHHDYPPRSHISLLSTQAWPFPEGHHRSRHQQYLEDNRTHAEARYRSEVLDRERGVYPTPKEFLAHSNLRFGVSGKPHSFPQATDLTVPGSQQYPVGFMQQLRSPHTASHNAPSATQTRPKTKAIRSSQVPQSSRYTAAEVDQMVDAVANYPGNIVPCTLCQKFVKRERLRAHIHECHLLTGEKIICPHCGIALKSKGSFRVHIWRHKRGALPTRSTMSDFERDRPPSPSTGPASH